MNAISSTLAALSIGDAAKRIFNSVPCQPASSVREAHG
jgi:hypothetical protein